jgi:hypothetical protein
MTSHQRYCAPIQCPIPNWHYTDSNQHWSDFIEAAGIPPEARGQDQEHVKLYVLIHSPSQQDLKVEAPIDTTIKTQFDSANWEQLRTCYETFRARDPPGVHPCVLLILDQQSTEDRKVIILHEGTAEWLTPEGEYADDTMQDREDLEKRTVWHKYRVPFEDAWAVQCAVEGFCGLEPAEPYFEKDVMGDVYMESEPEMEAETDSDGTTSEDLEYM